MPSSREGWALGTHVHHIDHLAPICELMSAVLIVPDRAYAELVEQNYPLLTTRIDQPWLRDGGFSGKVVYYSDLFPRPVLRQVFESNPGARGVFCPHGFSEKKQAWSATAVLQDVFLVHGQYGVDQLEAFGVLHLAERYVVTGNLRYRYYLRHKEFFDAAAARLLAGQCTGNRTILYAPTWADALSSTSVFDLLHVLVRELPDGYDLIVKPHPLLENNSKYLELLATLVSTPHVVVLRNTPLTYPLLARADTYIGDMSALAYDFLVFDRPMYFLNHTHGRVSDASGSRLFQCGVTLNPQDYSQIFRVVENGAGPARDYSATRRELWSYVYDASRTERETSEAIELLVEGPEPSWMRGLAGSADSSVGARAIS